MTESPRRSPGAELRGAVCDSTGFFFFGLDQIFPEGKIRRIRGKNPISSRVAEQTQRYALERRAGRRLALVRDRPQRRAPSDFIPSWALLHVPQQVWARSTCSSHPNLNRS